MQSQLKLCGKQGWLCGPLKSLLPPKGADASLCSAGTMLAPALLILLGSMGERCAEMSGEVWSPHAPVTANKSFREVGTQSVAFLQSTSYYRRSYRRLNCHFCWCQLRCEAAGRDGAIKKPLHPLPGLPRGFAGCQVQPASLEQKWLVLVLMMLGFISKAQQVVLVWMLNKRTSELKKVESMQNSRSKVAISKILAPVHVLQFYWNKCKSSLG